MNRFLIIGYISTKVYPKDSKTSVYYFALVPGSAPAPKANTNFFVFF